MTNSVIEKIDFQKLDTEEELKRVKNAMINVGFFKIRNYGISEQEKLEFENKSREFFKLDLKAKNKVLMNPLDNPLRGYSGYGVEKTAEGKPNIKVRI